MLSKKDIKILDILKENCKLSTREISNKTGVPITTVHNRIKKLKKDGIIKCYKAIIDNKKIGRGIEAFIQITVNYRYQERAIREVSLMPEVEECFLLTGTTDLLVKVATGNVDELNDFVINKLKTVKGVQKTLTSIVLREVP